MQLTNAQFLRAEDSIHGSTLMILDEGELVVSNKFFYADGNPKKDLVFTVDHGGQIKKLRLNGTSKKLMTTAFGSDTSNWAGKSALIKVMPSPIGQSQMIVLDPIIHGKEDIKDIVFKP